MGVHVKRTSVVLSTLLLTLGSVAAGSATAAQAETRIDRVFTPTIKAGEFCWTTDGTAKTLVSSVPLHTGSGAKYKVMTHLPKGSRYQVNMGCITAAGTHWWHLTSPLKGWVWDEYVKVDIVD